MGTDPSVYYETFAPLEPTGKPTVVMIHGGGHSASCWTATADGRPGWAYDFVRHGYPVVTPDWPGVGRSGFVPVDDLSGEIVCRGLRGVIDCIKGPVILVTHSMGGALGWIVAERSRNRLVALAAIAPGPPGNIQPEPEVLSATSAGITIQTPHRQAHLPAAGYVPNAAEFVDQKLIGDGTRFPLEARDRYAASLLALPSILLRERLNIAGGQLKVVDPACFRGLPTLVLTGTNDLEHPHDTDLAIVTWLEAAGARTEFIWLADHGISGNGHMLMLERNSAAIADLVCGWLAAAALPSEAE